MGFPDFSKNNQSLLAKYLTKEVFDALKDKKTSNMTTLQQVIASGVSNKDSNIGTYAGDKESYTVFAPLFDPIIKEYHGFTHQQTHKSNTDIHQFFGKNPDAENKYILSTRIRVARNLANYPLGTIISNTERKEVEQAVVTVLNELKGELEGNYFPLYDMPETVQKN